MGLLDGKVAIVTGAGHGIGRGHALELAKQGAKVVVNDLGGSVSGEGSGRDADLTVKLIEERGGEAVANYADVADYEAAGEMVQQAVDTYGQLDILVNNAGIVRDGAIWNMSEADFDAVMRVHVKGTWVPSHHAAKHWRARTKAGEALDGPHHQHDERRRPRRQLRPDQLRHRQVGHRRAHPHPQPRARQPRRDRQLHRSRPAPPGSPPRCPTRPRCSSPTTRRTTSSTGWTRPSAHPSWPGWPATRPQHVTGQIIRAVAENLIWMKGWTDGPTLSNGGQRWDATKLGRQLATDIFGTRAPGLRY